MQLRIKNAPTPPNNDVYLELKPGIVNPNDIDVRISRAGDLSAYYLLRINSDGTLTRYTGVPNDYGFQLEGIDNHIKERV